MKYILTSAVLIFIFISIAKTQDFTSKFNLEPVNIKIPHSLYNDIEFIDSRVDTSNLGIVQVGLMNHLAKVEPEIPLKLQFKSLLASIIDSTADNKKLILQLRHFVFAENTKIASENGYCYIRAILFGGSNDVFKIITSIDTIVVIKSIDVTNLLLKTGSQLLSNLIINNLTKEPEVSISHCYNEVIKLDSIEKRKLKAYNTDSFMDGLYSNYTSFKDQVPDEKIIVKFKKDNTIASVRKIDDNGEIIAVEYDNIYAIVWEGKPYIYTGRGFYTLYRNNDNFYFIGSVKPLTGSNANNAALAGVLFGTIGVIVAGSISDAPRENYFIVIDHINGGYIYIRKIPTKNNLYN